MYSYGLTSGNIDENSMFKVYMGEHEHLYERKDVLTRKKWLVTVLIDQSGSMADSTQNTNGSWSSQQEQANELAIVFGEALKSLHDLDFSIYGFSTNGSSIDTFVYKDKEVNKIEALIHAGSHEGTGMGFHIAHVGDKMISQYGEYDNKILFVVTDGEPNHTPTPTMNGYEHTRHCCDMLRRRGIQVFGIGIANAFGNTVGDRLFGSGQFCVINDVAGTLNVLVNKVRTFLQRQKK
jgi:nitric oxide reductase activation protein